MEDIPQNEGPFEVFQLALEVVNSRSQQTEKPVITLKSEDGKRTIIVVIEDYQPCVRVLVPDDRDVERLNTFLNEVRENSAWLGYVSHSFGQFKGTREFRGNELLRVCDIVTRSEKSRGSLARQLQGEQFQLVEQKIPFEVRFQHDTGIKFGLWYRVRFGATGIMTQRALASVRTAGTAIKLRSATVGSFERIDGIDKFAPKCMLSFDIEAIGGPEPNAFPDAKKPSNCVSDIGVAYHRSDAPDDIKTVGLVLLDPNSQHKQAKFKEQFKERSRPYAEFRTFASEKDLLLGFVELIHEVDPDFFTAYYGYNFDWPYLFARAEMLRCHEQFSRLGRVLSVRATLKTRTFGGTGGRPQQTQHTPIILGRMFIDTHMYLLSVKQLTDELPRTKLITASDKFLIELGNPARVSKLLLDFVDDAWTRLRVSAGQGCLQEIDLLDTEHRHDNPNPNSHMVDVRALNKRLNADNTRRTSTPVYTTKLDVPYELIPRYFVTRQFRERLLLSKYCVKDAVLPLLLMHTWKWLMTASQMSRIVHTSIDCLASRGQEYKLTSVFIRYAREHGYVLETNDGVCLAANKRPHDESSRFSALVPGTCLEVPERHPRFNEFEMKPEGVRAHVNSRFHVKPSEKKYNGALVCEADSQMFKDGVEKLLDFASLYPSIARAHDLSPERLPFQEKYYNLEGTKYTDVRVNETFQGRVAKVEGKAFIPGVLDGFILARKATRQRMKKLAVVLDDVTRADEHADARMLMEILNAAQLGQKVAANSVYGLLGSSNCKYSNMAVAEMITALGRQMLEATVLAVEEFATKKYNLPLQVIYGDSVTGTTPSVFRLDGTRILVLEVQALADHVDGWWSRMEGPGRASKWCCVPERLVEVWTDGGWSIIRNIIRHRVPASKRMFKVRCAGGWVACTEDHSLLDRTGTPFTPGSLLHFEDESQEAQPPQKAPQSLMLTSMVGDASSSASQQFMDTDAGQHIDGRAAEIQEIARLGFECSLAFGRRGVPEAILNAGRIDRWAFLEGLSFKRPFLQMQFDEMPDCVRPGATCQQLKEARNMLKRDETAGDVAIVRPDVATEVAIQSIVVLMYSMGFRSVVLHNLPDFFEDGATACFIVARRGAFTLFEDEATDIIELPRAERTVYDLTTSNSHFQAGVGSIVVHNTDSVFVHAPTFGMDTLERRKEAQAFAKELESWLTSMFPPPNEMEAEFIIERMVLQTKKCYAGLAWDPDKLDKPKKLKISGMDSKAQCPWNRRMLNRLLELVIQENNEPAAKQHLRNCVAEMVTHAEDPPLEEYQLSKPVNKVVNEDSSLVWNMINVARREAPGIVPAMGSQCTYVMIIEEGPLNKRGMLMDMFDPNKHTLDITEYLRALQGFLCKNLGRDIVWSNKFISDVIDAGINRLATRRETILGQLAARKAGIPPITTMFQRAKRRRKDGK